jgi:hypothetical protein
MLLGDEHSMSLTRPNASRKIWISLGVKDKTRQQMDVYIFTTDYGRCISDVYYRVRPVHSVGRLEFSLQSTHLFVWPISSL